MSLTEHGGRHTYPATMTAVALASSWRRRGGGGCRSGGIPGSQPPLCLSAPPALPLSFFLLLPPLSLHAVYGQSQWPTVTQCIRSRGIRTHSSAPHCLPPGSCHHQTQHHIRRGFLWSRAEEDVMGSRANTNSYPFPGRKNASLYSLNTKATQQLAKASFSAFQNL